MWTLVPAPSLPTLALAVVVPELGPWGAGLALIGGAIAQFAGRGWARDVGTACAACALGCALVPWCLLPTTVAHGEREMRAAFGGAEPPSGEAPYSLRIALLGYPRPAAIHIRRDLAVPARDGTRLALDVYAPQAGGAHPTIVLIYGGAWIFGTRADSAGLATYFASHGYTAIAIDYRHAPAYQFPVQYSDVRDALAAIARNATQWNVDPQRVAILGRSAGAELALLAGFAQEPLPIRAVIAYYAPTDLVAGYRVPPRPDPVDVDRILRAYIGGTPEERMDRYIAASPTSHVRPGLPPTLLVGGGRDELVRLGFAHELRDALRAHGARVAALDIPWSNHAFDEIESGTGGQLARYYTDRFLLQTLRGSERSQRHRAAISRSAMSGHGPLPARTYP